MCPDADNPSTDRIVTRTGCVPRSVRRTQRCWSGFTSWLISCVRIGRTKPNSASRRKRISNCAISFVSRCESFCVRAAIICFKRRYLGRLGLILVLLIPMAASATFPELERALRRAQAKQKADAVAAAARKPVPGPTDTIQITILPPIYVPEWLNWEYDLPLPRMDTTFIILRAETPNGPWTKFGETNQPPFKVIPDGFYRVETKTNL